MKGFHCKPTCNNEYMKTKISPYNENFHGNKRIIKDEYYGNSVLLLLLLLLVLLLLLLVESISEVKTIINTVRHLQISFLNSIPLNAILLKSIIKIVCLKN